jgi:hypothetical protein
VVLHSSAAPSALPDSTVCTSDARRAFTAGRYMEDARRCAGSFPRELETVTVQGLDTETQIEALWTLIMASSE